MDIDDALNLATRFILVRLHGSFGDIEPLNASFDEETGIWRVTCTFKRSGSTSWSTVHIEIDDENEEVVSFEVT